jgi:hypothetical protein
VGVEGNCNNKVNVQIVHERCAENEYLQFYPFLENLFTGNTCGPANSRRLRMTGNSPPPFLNKFGYRKIERIEVSKGQT